MTPLRIRTASRLHFGLLGWGPHAPRQFGGVGLMVEHPGLELTATPADEFQAVGRLSDRVASLLDRMREKEASGSGLRPARIEVVAAPDEHMGLGVGTQLSLAVAGLLLTLSGVGEPSVEALARLSERGRRSGVGLHGFLHGGLVVDGGHKVADDVPPLVSRMDFPPEWSILIVRPPGPEGRHGAEEALAFAELPPCPERVTERLCRLVLLDLLSAVAEHDLAAFGAAVSELQHRVGTAFAPAQGGVYATPESETLVDDFARLGLVGGGQSSWGPLLYAFGDLSAEERQAVADWLVDRRGLDRSEILWTRARNQGASITSL
ncbi:MAG: beta-RFAP synthase [Paludisphaera borealis]|uniref:beta-ribofuranosylaminobenzene 5'-phosphate synthase family protein n=1 Tax=Paludisphaera borealis TaxID=1387353 RepID=UPI00284C7870|nr:beta-ribofuranosylaminobenzene 5'-phosphate synthase family protein [Paludisphaera borealis]MDR3620999.1 beta-RFAP synthase [Paludisphaera borealis]